jgi:rhodanese-related sulfurtransferase
MFRKTCFTLAAVLLLCAPAPLHAQEAGDGVGDYAAVVTAPATVPAGHFALIATYADRFLSANSGTGGHRTVYAQSLVDGIDDPAKADEIGDYYLLDIRRPADYAAGHIAGAVNVQFGDVANPGVLAALPLDRPILVICYTGHTASIANAVLATLGYDAWTLRFGMTSWKASSPTAVWSASVKQAIAGGDYPVVTGTAP